MDQSPAAFFYKADATDNGYRGATGFRGFGNFSVDALLLTGSGGGGENLLPTCVLCHVSRCMPCTTTMRDLEAPLPAYQGRGRRPKSPWQSVTEWRQGLEAEAWTYLTVRDGEKGPVEIEMVKCRVQTRFERKHTGPAE